jgi:conjugal transfer/entry exclusion protein
MFKKLVSLVTFYLLTGYAIASSGPGLGNIVFDPTNYGRNIITAAQSVEAVQRHIEGNLTKLYQLQEMYRQGRAIASGDLNAAATVVGGPQLAAQIRDAQGIYRALGNLNGGLGDLQARYNYARQMAQRYGLTMQEYQRLQAERAANNNREAQAQQDANVRSALYVQETYASVQRLQAQNPTTDTALFQTMNKQMSILNTTNAKLLDSIVVKDQLEQAKRIDDQANAEKLREINRQRILDAANGDQDLRQRMLQDREAAESIYRPTR